MAPSLPKTVADLAQWQVYADELIERGDPVGSFVSHDLAMPSSPSKNELEVFHREARRVCRSPRVFRVAWTLGHARSLIVVGNPSRRLLMSRQPADLPLDVPELKQLRRFLHTPICSQLEAINVLLDPGTASVWASVLGRLPATCTRIGLNPHQWSDDDTRRVLDSLSPPLKTIVVWPHGAKLAQGVIDSRFEEIDARGGCVDLQLAQVLRNRLDAHPGVRLRIGSVTGRDVLDLLGPRVVVGGPEDAALIHVETGAVQLLPQQGLHLLQAQSGIVTARAQVARSIIERHCLTLDPVRAGRAYGDHLVRRDGGVWTARFRPDDNLRSLSIDGQPVGLEPVRVLDGARVELDGQPFRFVERMSA